jgi:hypothetical protein
MFLSRIPSARFVTHFPDSPRQTGRATFIASGFPEVGLPPRDHSRFVIRFDFTARPTSGTYRGYLSLRIVNFLWPFAV